MSETLPISEVFGNTIQGEGPRAGRRCAFIRVGGCNLSCSWCDSDYTWNGEKYNLRKEIAQMTVEEILAALPVTDEVVITGGEPLLYQDRDVWGILLRHLARRSIFINIETNGTIAPNLVTRTYVGHFSISPKLKNAGPHRGGQNPEMAPWPGLVRHHNSILKFVVADDDDVKEALTLAENAGWMRQNVWLMPEGVTKRKVLERWPWVIECAVAHGVNATQRLHVLAYDNRRGV